ncbi:ribosome-inactivating family protein [Streptomyces acidicola]|uniref:ribosome-inactivating family protein n=1 Tax=Streptomyces acidicola TaxID=2596892 RepID=UPI00342B529C
MHLHVATPEPPVHGPGHHHHARRISGKFLALYLLISGVLAGAVLVAPQFDEKAGAVDGNGDITWDVNGGLPAYQAMIKAVRERAAGGGMPEEVVPEEDVPWAAHVFAVGLRTGEAPGNPDAPRVSLLVQARALAIIGYRLRTPRGHNRFFCFRGTKCGGTPDELRFRGDHRDMERVGGRHLAGLVIDEQLVTRSFTRLRDDTDQASTARALMVFTVTVSEAARSDALEQAIRPAFGNGSHTVSRAEAELMTSH